VGICKSVNEMDKIGDRLLVVYDGYCGLCNGWVRWLLPRDRRDRLRFVAYQSEKVTELLARHGMDAETLATGAAAAAGPETILAVRDAGGATEFVLVQSDAVIAVLNELPQPWPAVAATMRFIPRLIRDWGYGLVARWRYRIWGRLESCPLPAAEDRSKFL
jgi:predicted DCC family thiol-disulfide oxidoreductase YuxK